MSDTSTTVPRGAIEEALALDPPAELLLDVVRRPEGTGEAVPRTVSVAWKRKDLESLLEDPHAAAITLSFDPTELEAAIEGSEVEGHGLRDTAAVLTVAAAAAAAGASGAFGAVHEGATQTERGVGVQSAATVHTEASLTERGIDPGRPAASHDEATFTARGIDPGTPAASHDEATYTARGIDTGSPAVHEEATFTARGLDPGRPAASHDEATFAARGIDAGSLPAVHDEMTLAARGIDPGTVPAGAEAGGSGFDLPSVDPATAAGLAGGLAGAGLIIAAAAFATRRREPGTA
jgi:hypothetical protein